MVGLTLIGVVTAWADLIPIAVSAAIGGVSLVLIVLSWIRFSRQRARAQAEREQEAEAVRPSASL